MECSVWRTSEVEGVQSSQNFIPMGEAAWCLGKAGIRLEFQVCPHGGQCLVSLWIQDPGPPSTIPFSIPDFSQTEDVVNSAESSPRFILNSWHYQTLRLARKELSNKTNQKKKNQPKYHLLERLLSSETTLCTLCNKPHNPPESPMRGTELAPFLLDRKI